MGKTYVYIGNRVARDPAAEEGAPECGIAICEYDARSGGLTRLKNVFEQYYVGCIQIDRARNVLYCTNETADYPGLRGGGGGQALAFSINPADASLTRMGGKPSYGSKPSFLTPTGDSRYLLVANHGGRSAVTHTTRDAFGRYHLEVLRDESSLALFPLGEDGGIGEPVDIHRLNGMGPKSFQPSAHAHHVVQAPGRNLYVVCDKGGDQIFLFRIDHADERIVPCCAPYRCAPGSAPRYGVFHPALPYLYVNKEAETMLSCFRYSDKGLTRVETINTLPKGYAPPPPEGLSHSDLRIDGAGRFLYVMLRILDIISVYRIDQGAGRLTHVQTIDTPAGGRALALSPDGRFLVAAFFSAATVRVYPVGEDGRLGEATASLDQPSPSALAFFEA